MKYKKRKFYLKGIYESAQEAAIIGKAIRRKTGAQYNVTRNGIYGGWELWVTKKGYWQ